MKKNGAPSASDIADILSLAHKSEGAITQKKPKQVIGHAL